ncbi:MAG: hypothetical protein U1E16_04685 [Hyphomicrobiales bacterium]
MRLLEAAQDGDGGQGHGGAGLADVLSLKPRQQRYSQFLNEEGGTCSTI